MTTASTAHVALPSELRTAVSALGGGKLTLIVGAGCSFEPPTSLPLAADCSQQCHDRLVADGILEVDDCNDPRDLSALADAVHAKRGSQKALVDQMSQHYLFKAATPNEGHMLAAALVQEEAIANIVTLNFDLALSVAAAELGAGDQVGLIEGPEDFRSQKRSNIYYLHRNINKDPEVLVLRKVALEEEWRGSWQVVIASKVMAAPITVFVGLGTPAGVLIESSKLIRDAVPKGNDPFQVDPGEHGTSAFSTALQIDKSHHVQAGWCEFMNALAQRFVQKLTQDIQAAANNLVKSNQLAPEQLTPLLQRFDEIGLIKIGSLRSAWLLHNKKYLRDDPATRDLVADLLLAAAMIARITGSTPTLFDDGVVEFRRGDRVASAVLFISGRGTRSWLAIEAELSSRQRLLRGRATRPTGAVVAALTSSDVPVSVPRDVLLGEIEADIVSGHEGLPLYHVEAIRREPHRSSEVAP